MQLASFAFGKGWYADGTEPHHALQKKLPQIHCITLETDTWGCLRLCIFYSVAMAV